MNGYYSHLPACCQPGYGFTRNLTRNLTRQLRATCLRQAMAETAHAYPAGLAAIAACWR
jgi:hypothetical protein